MKEWEWSRDAVIKTGDSELSKQNLSHRRYVDHVYLFISVINQLYVVGPCHHGMARPQVADRGTASDKEGSCE